MSPFLFYLCTIYSFPAIFPFSLSFSSNLTRMLSLIRFGHPVVRPRIHEHTLFPSFSQWRLSGRLRLSVPTTRRRSGAVSCFFRPWRNSELANMEEGGKTLEEGQNLIRSAVVVMEEKFEVQRTQMVETKKKEKEEDINSIFLGDSTFRNRFLYFLFFERCVWVIKNRWLGYLLLGNIAGGREADCKVGKKRGWGE